MRVGAVVPATGSLPIEPGLAAIAAAAEEAGASSLWVDDHLLSVRDPRAGYPHAHDRPPGWDTGADRYESLICCAWIAAATTRCRVGTAALVLPQRNALEVAKVGASLDQLSGGRLVLGIGVGWQAGEMEALGYPFPSRGRRADEMIDVLRSCWTGEPTAVCGQHVTVPEGVITKPTPVSTRGIPLLVGGMSRAALRRAAARGDGWLPVARPHNLDLAGLSTSIAALGELRREHDRNGEQFELVLKLHSGDASARDIAEIAVEVARLGFDELIIEPEWSDRRGAQAFIRTVQSTVERAA